MSRAKGQRSLPWPLSRAAAPSAYSTTRGSPARLGAQKARTQYRPLGIGPPGLWELDSSCSPAAAAAAAAIWGMTRLTLSLSSAS